MFYDLPTSVYALIPGNDDVVLLESARCDEENFRSFLFVHPLETIAIHSPGEIPGLFSRIEQHLRDGHFVAGYFAYESGFHFEAIADLAPASEPIAWFGAYREPLVFNHRTGVLSAGAGSDAAGSSLGDTADTGSRIEHIRLAVTPEEYDGAIERIKEHIRSGDTYQINYTTTYDFEVEGSTLALYRELKKRQRVPFAAYIRNGDHSILSSSPELFFRRSGQSIITKPMKGTVRRGRTNAEDDILARWLHDDPKNRSENIMIVDLLRNDLGRISELGSVRVSDLFLVERFDSLLQMTTAVEGTLRPDVTYYDIFRSLFPCGSVTRAPKIRAMKIISGLERRRRGVYTGAIGYFAPGGAATFNVAIRTLVVDGRNGEMGVGGGIVCDSSAQGEFAECQLKARFLTSTPEEFGVFESLLWDGGYPFMELHLERLSDSARYFEYPFDGGSARVLLEERARLFPRDTRWKVRLTLDRHGSLTLEQMTLEENSDRELRVTIADVRTDSGDTFRYHKTTRRRLYDELGQRALNDGFADIIFQNERGEITEGAVSNLFIRSGNRLFTPPLSCGVLNGVYRRHVLRTNPEARERTLSLDDLESADALYICNAVRGMREVTLVSSGPAGAHAKRDSAGTERWRHKT